MVLETAGAVFVASLLGSLHCAAMCGGLVGALSAEADRPRWARQQACFHLGRGIMYVLLGISAGALGGAVNLVGKHAGVADVAGIVAGALVLAAGLFGLLATQGLAPGRGAALLEIGAWTRLRCWLGRQLVGSAHRPLLRAALLGTTAALLPCGWLYAFVFAAAGTGDPLAGGLVLLTFWLGTLPALVGVGAVVRRLTGSLGRHVAFLSAGVLVVLGLGTILHRVNIPALAFSQLDATTFGAPAASELPCHSAGAR